MVFFVCGSYTGCVSKIALIALNLLPAAENAHSIIDRSQQAEGLE